ncbi:HAMP domain-containing protein [Aromatoleum toluvorans]|uniref:histidine kinase n=1 Tax=Aromatoleum toluvorans TaxID=92002 RepID=A0ABX1Q3F2_9RHOO|nr:sensor histidine kinase [Aromatoleum toluvorans]NMG46247.1 HAMP domain-containing protein [Aromatoleum toluvorans]
MPAPARQRPLDLKRHLLIRVALFALAVLVLGSAVALLEARHRVRSDIQRTGLTIQQLITDEINRNSTSYDRSLADLELDLTPLKPIGALLDFCIGMTDIYSHEVGHHCFAGTTPVPEPVESFMRWVIGSDAVYRGIVGQYPGITVGQLVVTPNYGSEVLELAKMLANLLAVSLMILLLSFFVYRPVRNALAPSEAILDTLTRMRQGDLHARVPAFALIELDRIGEGFNHLADRLESTIQNQQRLAHRLLSAREEERQHLARELHDEFGQYLASLNAEAAFARELADEGMAALRPCADSIRNTAGHMMETLQQILHRLRPVGLDEFGLVASLEQLIEGWNRRCRATHFTLAVEDAAGDSVEDNLGDLPDNIAVSVYRIVQESVTNAVRHGQASRVAVRLQRTPGSLELEIRDDGQGSAPPELDEGGKAGGFGLLGMEERVLALGGVLAIRPGPERGTLVSVSLPLSGLEATAAGDRS